MVGAPVWDLKVEAISGQATGVGGQVVDIEWTVRNIGAAAATGSWIDRVYLRRAGDTGAGTLIGTYSYTGPLDAGKTYSRKEEMRLPVKVSDNYEEIGRETGRERVCQYVWISVEAVSLKKKKQQ